MALLSWLIIPIIQNGITSENLKIISLLLSVIMFFNAICWTSCMAQVMSITRPNLEALDYSICSSALYLGGTVLFVVAGNWIKQYGEIFAFQATATISSIGILVIYTAIKISPWQEKEHKIK